MANGAWIFPLLTVILLLLLFGGTVRLANIPLKLPLAEGWRRADSVCVLVITLAYAAVAFTGLGNTRGVEHFCEFPEWGSYVDITLPQPTVIGAVRYYSGFFTGNYYLQFSEDGETFTDVSTMPQGHADVFKWNDAALEVYDQPVHVIRILADSRLWMGELALYDWAGDLMPAAELEFSAECAPLFDEQSLIPAEQNFLNSTYFDEIYHVRTAVEHIENIYPYEISHPPLGKLILSLGIRMFGMTPFGWRFMGTLLGVAMLPALYVFLKKLFGGIAVPACCTAVFAFDFMHFVQTRIATIDTYAVLFTILMYLFFWLYLRSDRTRTKSFLPPLALSGLCFGLGAASKWTCIYAGGGLAVLWLLDRIFRAGEQSARGEAWGREAGENILWCLLFFVAVPAMVYYVSYWPYGTASGLQGPGMLFTKDYFHIVIDNQTYMFRYHSGVDATHPYSSVWWQWILDIRPILYYLQYFENGTHSSFGAWVNPMLCWGGLLAMLCVIFDVIRHRDRAALFILVGYLAQLLPWTLVTRVVFEYHYFPSTVFLTLAIGYVFRKLQLNAPHWRRTVFTFTAVSLALFIVFYPALSGVPVTDWYGHNFLKWFPTWPF